MQSCNRAIVNVTIKIDDDLCRQARHRAVDADLSLSGWVARVLEKELREEPVNKTIAELIRMDDDRDLMDFIPDRRDAAERPIQFP